ncbi:ABC transporter substrate-binding protein [Metabacillus niabensis]|uniref:Iron complex transport system substrate-binding protein n=1 Tax=Metabacillus niabensis TaxID=324854 RepID=A0ABT9Z8H8_9BACI|nr:ABC transporter substrate-binding protein [Metabacillus niabensis]MDQ0228229.1 iron complex transport system substrate-binding protein [Metabacillus niabensis]
MKQYKNLIVILALLLLVACGNERNVQENLESSSTNREIKITDDTGTELVFEDPPKRIGCLTEICVDTLKQLGLTPTAVSSNGITQEPEFFGEKGKDIAIIGGSFFEPNLEDMLSNDLDLVIGLGGVHDNIREALGSEIPLYIASPGDYHDSISTVEKLGELLQKRDEASKAVQTFEKQLEEYKTLSTHDKTALIMYGSDVNFGIDTNKSVMGSLLSEITNYPWEAPTGEGHNNGGVQFSLEEVLKVDPDVIFVETFSFGSESSPSLSEQLAKNPIWSELKAVKENKVHEVRTNIWANGRGIGSMSIVLNEAMSILYPESVEE